MKTASKSFELYPLFIQIHHLYSYPKTLNTQIWFSANLARVYIDAESKIDKNCLWYKWANNRNNFIFLINHIRRLNTIKTSEFGEVHKSFYDLINIVKPKFFEEFFGEENAIIDMPDVFSEEFKTFVEDICQVYVDWESVNKEANEKKIMLTNFLFFKRKTFSRMFFTGNNMFNL